MRGALVDLDGVIYQNSQLITGADATVQWLQKQGIPHLFVTNTTSKPRSAIVTKLAGMGIAVDENAILTPVVAARAYLERLDDPCLGLFVVESTAKEFSDWRQCHSEQDGADAVILGDLGELWSFERLNQAFSWLMANPNAELLALGMTRYWRGARGLQLDVGPFVKALAYASGREPKVLGKPDPLFFQLAANQLNLPVSQLAMIGDDAYSDVKAAQDAGLQGVMVKTGKFQEADLATVTPDLIVDSIADLPSQWVSSK